MNQSAVQYGLIGKSLEHSLSKNYFNDFFLKHNINATYQNFAIDDVDTLRLFLETTTCNFFNVTIPYKQSIIPFLKLVGIAAKAINAVNCIKKIDGQWIGYNSDAIGFEKSFIDTLMPWHKQAMILGNGGAAQAVKFVLNKYNIPFVTVTRKSDLGSIHYADIDKNIIEKYPIIINTTPLGMYPNVESLAPLPYELINEQNYLFDLVYNPNETAFLKKGKQQGAKTKNGLDMLTLQAIAAWQWWNEK